MKFKDNELEIKEKMLEHIIRAVDSSYEADDIMTKKLSVFLPLIFSFLTALALYIFNNSNLIVNNTLPIIVVLCGLSISLFLIVKALFPRPLPSRGDSLNSFEKDGRPYEHTYLGLVNSLIKSYRLKIVAVRMAVSFKAKYFNASVLLTIASPITPIVIKVL